MRDLADVQQAVLAGQDVDQRAEVEDLGHRALVDLADLGLGGDLADALHRVLGARGVGRGHGDRAVLGDVDGRAGLLGQRADRRPALADHVADLLRVDLHRVQARRKRAELVLGAADGLDHARKDVQARLLGLGQRDLHDLLGDALDLDVHLQRGHAGGRAGDLEVHVAEVVLVAEDVGQHREAVAVLDQAHRDAGHMRLHRHAGVHQREAAAADRGHRRRAVALGDLADHPHHVGEFVARGQARHQGTLGQPAVTDLAALGAADAAGLAGGERRHVVVQQEAVLVVAGQRVDPLRVLLGAQRGHDQGLRLAAREQRRAVRARQHAGTDLDRAHGAGVAAVDARFAGKNLAAHDARLDVEQQGLDLDLVAGEALGGQRGLDAGVGLAAGLRARLLAADLVGRAQPLLGQRAEPGDEGLVPGRRRPQPGGAPLGLAGFAHQGVDRLDRELGLLVAVDDRAEHDFLAQLVGLGLDHQHGGLGAGDDQVEAAARELRLAGVEHILAVDVAHARCAYGSVEGDARDRQRGAGGDQRGDVGLHLRVEAEHMHDDLHLVVEALGEQRADRAVDQAAGQGLELAGAALALEEAARDAARGVGLLDVVDGQREEVLPRLGVLGGHDGGQHDGVVDVDEHRAAGLAGDLAGLEAHGMRAPLEGLGDFVEQAHQRTPVGGAAPLRRCTEPGAQASWRDAIPASQRRATLE